MFSLGTFSLLAYGLGIPILGFAVLWARRERLYEAPTRRMFGFLYITFRPAYWYWETVILLRKVGLATIAVLMAPAGVGLQVTLTMLLLTGCLLAHSEAQPYRDRIANRLEGGSLVVAITTLACGATLIDDDVAEYVKVTASFLLVGLNAVFLAVLVGILVRAVATDQDTHAFVRRLHSSAQTGLQNAKRNANRIRRKSLTEWGNSIGRRNSAGGTAPSQCPTPEGVLPPGAESPPEVRTPGPE